MFSVSFLLLLYTIEAEAVLLDFDDFATGEIVNSQYLDDYGVLISAQNSGYGHDLAIIFDSQHPTSDDYDLAGPAWAGGNLALANTILGKILIIAENNVDSNLDGLIDSPDDEGSRPAGSIFFDFNSPMCSIGFDLIDVEGPSEYGRNSGFVATFFMDDTPMAQIGFDQFINKDGIFYDQTVQYGNNKANRIMPITVDDLSTYTKTYIAAFDRVEFNLGGSSAIDNIDVTKCELLDAQTSDNVIPQDEDKSDKVFDASLKSQEKIAQLENKVKLLETELSDKNNQLVLKDKVLLEQLKVINDLMTKIEKVIFEPFINNLPTI